MRDLGIDHSAGRRRRIATLKKRFNKNKQRRIKLRPRKLPNLKTRLRLHRGGVQPVALRGFEGQGLAPRYRQGLRHALATHLGLHQGGQPDVVYDQHSSKYLDPGDQIVIQHIHALHQLVHQWPQDHRPHIEKAWIQLRNKLSKQQHPWYHVKGPMAATLAYLHEWGWTTHSLHQWTRYETAFMTEANINLLDDWNIIEATLSQQPGQLARRRPGPAPSLRSCTSKSSTR